MLGLQVQLILGPTSSIRGHTAWSMECLQCYGSNVLGLIVFSTNKDSLFSDHGFSQIMEVPKKKDDRGHGSPFLDSGHAIFKANLDRQDNDTPSLTFLNVTL